MIICTFKADETKIKLESVLSWGGGATRQYFSGAPDSDKIETMVISANDLADWEKIDTKTANKPIPTSCFIWLLSGK